MIVSIADRAVGPDSRVEPIELVVSETLITVNRVGNGFYIAPGIIIVAETLISRAGRAGRDRAEAKVVLGAVDIAGIGVGIEGGDVIAEGHAARLALGVVVDVGRIRSCTLFDLIQHRAVIRVGDRTAILRIADGGDSTGQVKGGLSRVGGRTHHLVGFGSPPHVVVGKRRCPGGIAYRAEPPDAVGPGVIGIGNRLGLKR